MELSLPRAKVPGNESSSYRDVLLFVLLVATYRGVRIIKVRFRIKKNGERVAGVVTRCLLLGASTSMTSSYEKGRCDCFVACCGLETGNLLR